MTNIRYFPKNLTIHNQIDLQLRQIIKEKNWPKLIRLSRKASIKYVLEDGHERINEGAKYHLLEDVCLVELRYNDSTVKWFKINVGRPP